MPPHGCRHGVRGLVIDPYNEISHQRPGNVSETDFVSTMLSKVKRFAQQ
jgi:twinkle protein